MKFFDAHSDIFSDITIHRLDGETDVFHNHHLQRLQKGGVEGSIWVIWVDPPYDYDHQKRTKQIFDCAKREIRETKDFRIVHNYKEMMKAKEDGIFYVFIGVEGMAYVGSDLNKIDEYYEFGARHGMLTWNEVNDLGAGANSGVNTGLTPLGKKAAKHMQDLGMILDTSHLNEAGFWDIADLATKPFIASHSNCSALCGVPRNLTDEQLRAIRDCNGVVGINSFGAFTSADPSRQTVEQLAQHAAHMIDIMGIDHVMCGFDFCEFFENDDTMGSMVAGATADVSPSVKGMETAEFIPNLFHCFEKMGMSTEDQEKIAWKNMTRVIREVLG